MHADAPHDEFEKAKDTPGSMTNLESHSSANSTCISTQSLSDPELETPLPHDGENGQVQRAVNDPNVFEMSRAAVTVAQVFTNEAILLLILRNLKNMLAKDVEPPETSTLSVASSWKTDFVPVIFLNQRFFRIGTDMLWNTMESITPALKLLPWFKSDYKGLGTFKYAGLENWERFGLYASHIQHISFLTALDTKISPPWLLELVTLHGKPDLMFPALQSIYISPEAYLSATPFLFILAGAPLESLNIAALSDIQDGADKPPSDWETTVESEETIQENLLPVLPKLSAACPNLQSFQYRGPAGPALLHRISTLKYITRLHLTVTNELSVELLCDTVRNTGISELTLVVPLLFGVPDGDAVKTIVFTKELPRDPPQYFDSLRIIAPEQQPYALWTRFNTMTKRLCLELINTSETKFFHLSLWQYMGSSKIEELAVNFIMSEFVRRPTIRVRTSVRVKKYKLRSLFAESKAQKRFNDCMNLRRVTINGVPPHLLNSTSTLLQNAMPHWKLLTILIFRVDSRKESLSPGDASTTKNDIYPGLSFLQTTVRPGCPLLETLEFLFDQDKVSQEDLSPFLRLDSESNESLSDSHSLHDLTVYTINTGQSLDLDLKRKVQIAMFLDRNFPRLSNVRGSASETWGEIDTLVKSFQDVKEHMCTLIERF